MQNTSDGGCCNASLLPPAPFDEALASQHFTQNFPRAPDGASRT